MTRITNGYIFHLRNNEQIHKIRLIIPRNACRIRASTQRDINLFLFSNRLVKYFKKKITLKFTRQKELISIFMSSAIKAFAILSQMSGVIVVPFILF